MHDIHNLDQRGVAGLFIASDEFRAATAAQAQALGFAVPVFFVPHPIQDRTDAELHALVDAAFDALLAALTAG